MPDTDGYIYFGSKSGFKVTSSFFVSSKLFAGKDDVEGKWQKRELSSTHGYFLNFLKGMLTPWHGRQLTVLTLQS